MPSIATLEATKAAAAKKKRAAADAQAKAERALREERIRLAIAECEAVVAGEADQLDVNNAIGAALYRHTAGGEDIDWLVVEALRALGYEGVSLTAPGHVTIASGPNAFPPGTQPDTQQWSTGTIREEA